jgi:hypothetical protein
MTLGEAATRVEDTLSRAGYADLRWFPIGVHYEHGFAVTTRVERVHPEGTPKPLRDRWLVSYPEAAGLLWLAGSTEPYLPVAGGYRVMLVAFTDLHIPIPGRPTRLDESTAMEAPGQRAGPMPWQRHVPAGYRLGVYVYEYEAESVRRTKFGKDRLVPFGPRLARELEAYLAMRRRGRTPLKRLGLPRRAWCCRQHQLHAQGLRPPMPRGRRWRVR